MGLSSVSAKPTFSDQPYKFRLSAIKKINPAHIDDKNYTSNVQWSDLSWDRSFVSKTKPISSQESKSMANSLDVVVAMLLMSVNKKVKVLSPTNKVADSFFIKLLVEIARLEEIGVVITDKHVVRFYSSETEQSVLKVDSQKFVTRDITQSRWRPAPPNSIFDAMIMRIFE